MHVRIKRDDSAIAECIIKYVNMGTSAGLQIAQQVDAMNNFLIILEGQFNRTLPLSDLSEETIDNARLLKNGDTYFVEDVRFTQSISVFLESLRVIKPLTDLLGIESDKDKYSHICQIIWKDGSLSALAFYIHPEIMRSFIIWWVGPTEEIDDLANNHAESKLRSLDPAFVEWLST